MKELKYKTLKVAMDDGSVWGVPVEVIALSHASYHRKFHDGDSEAALHKETIPLFNEHSDEIMDWAENNMNWSDVAEYAFIISNPKVDFDEGWLNGDKEVS